MNDLNKNLGRGMGWDETNMEEALSGQQILWYRYGEANDIKMTAAFLRDKGLLM